MPNDTSDQDIRQSLARAFDRVWAVYYRPGRLTLSQDIARTELAKRLIQLAKEGGRDENSLSMTKGGLSHLALMALKEAKTAR
jgi:hypothetical protein